MREIKICLDGAEKERELSERLTKLNGNFVIDAEKQKLNFDSEDANLLLEISDYLK